MTKPLLIGMAGATLGGCGGGSTSSTASVSSATSTVSSPVTTSSTRSEPTPTPGPAACASIPTDAYARAVLADHPIAYYRLGEGSGPTMCDASASRNSGGYDTHGITYAQAGPLQPGRGAAIAADGTAHPGTSGSSSGITGTADFTLEGWFRTTSRRDQIVVDIGQPGKGGMAGIGPSSSPANSICGGVADGVGFDTYDGYVAADANSVGINVFDGRWHDVVGKYTAAGGGTAVIYLDGKRLKSAGITDQPAASPVRVGYWVDQVCNAPLTGSAAEVAVYGAALTAQQVTAHYSAATG